MYAVLNVHPSGYYESLQNPVSNRAKEDQKLTPKIKQYWLESGCVYGYRNIHEDLVADGIDCGRDREFRLMQEAGIKAERGYKAPGGMYGGSVAEAAPNHLNRQFTVTRPNEWWVSDITYIKTHEGFLFVAVIMDLFSRAIVGWSMGNHPVI
jgi:putative transposase